MEICINVIRWVFVLYCLSDLNYGHSTFIDILSLSLIRERLICSDRVMWLRIVCLTLVCTRLAVHGRTTGAPSSACTSMNPQHLSNTAQVGSAPFEIVVSNTSYTPNQGLTGMTFVCLFSYHMINVPLLQSAFFESIRVCGCFS